MIDALLEKNLLPDWLVRFGIRRLLAQRVKEITPRTAAEGSARKAAYVRDLDRRALAEQTDAANQQHYEVPTEFYQACLGPRLKYSGCLYPSGQETLGQAEEAMLAVYAERARIEDGQEILELGCGWGSLSLYLAETFPHARITGVSNSRTQKAFIDRTAQERGLGNLQIITCDVNDLQLSANRFDRVVSVEMFEHLKNYRLLLRRVAGWMKSGGYLFVHIFTHTAQPYHFVARDESDWMSRYFFTGGQMPSHDLLMEFQDDLKLTEDWRINGQHYQRTAEQWLQNMDSHQEELEPLFARTYGRDARKWWAYWRTFYLSCAELWGYRGGEEWIVSHYLFQKP